MTDKNSEHHSKEENQTKPELPDLGDSPSISKQKRAGGKYYGVDLDADQLLCLEIECRNGRDLGIPYAPTPWSEFVPDDQEGLILRILDFEYEVLVKGRGLNHLKKFIRTRKLAWLKESKSGKDTGEGDVFISEIQIHRRKD